METVQIQCGSCGKVMAVQVEHLGAQVHCPHCQAIVQAPTENNAPRASGSDGADYPGIDSREIESIFTPGQGDELFEEPSDKPLVELPPDPSSAEDSIESPTLETTSLPHLMLPLPAAPELAPPWSSATAAQDQPADRFEDSAQLPTPETPPTVVKVAAAKRSLLVPYLLIFLIPYALIATGVIAYLLYNQSKNYDPLEHLPDPKPKEGPRHKVKHDSPLSGKLKIRFAESLRVGDMEMTPVKVEAVDDTELALYLRVRNLSTEYLIHPMSDEFLRYAKGRELPYTYLDWSQKKLFGGFLQFFKDDEPTSAELAPGQSALVKITTVSEFKNDVPKILKSGEDLVWRVQVRRGFVDVRGKQISATTVIGVEFNAKSIQRAS
ncbi:MAG: hypothetical protein L0Y72_05350 [Gemmataceae bacterium]|nr:hypothetical protein [Gemmataceae bacterium]MCI0738449.1 hypothetical protein [Gemmataceae bacterium]